MLSSAVNVCIPWVVITEASLMFNNPGCSRLIMQCTGLGVCSMACFGVHWDSSALLLFRLVETSFASCRFRKASCWCNCGHAACQGAKRMSRVCWTAYGNSKGCWLGLPSLAGKWSKRVGVGGGVMCPWHVCRVDECDHVMNGAACRGTDSETELPV